MYSKCNCCKIVKIISNACKFCPVTFDWAEWKPKQEIQKSKSFSKRTPSASEVNLDLPV